MLARLRQQRCNSVLFLIGKIGRIPLAPCLPASVTQPESPEGLTLPVSGADCHYFRGMPLE